MSLCRAAEAVQLDPTGQTLCEEKGEGTHTERFASTNGVKIRAVCRDGKTDAVVRYAWYFDDRGRQIREEDVVPGNPSATRITITDYDLHDPEPIGKRIYDGNGRIVETVKQAGEPKAEKNAAKRVTTYNQYLTACQESPQRLLHPIFGLEKEPQFFTKSACTCVAEKAVRDHRAPMTKVWQRSKSLNPSEPKDRLTVAALQHLGECLCPHAFPDSRLEKLCPRAVEIEKAWRP